MQQRRATFSERPQEEGAPVETDTQQKSGQRVDTRTDTAISQPLVSVGCAVYNGAETLRRALDALVRQDYPCLEIIMCDDGSTDASRAICQEYAARYTNIRYAENEVNLGIIGNYNKLFRLAKGKYFLWADQDDVREPSCISKCVAVLEADPEAVLCHSHTGVFWKSFRNLMHINTIDSVDNESSVLKRYWRFLRRYSDTTIYGLIRSEALRKTALWRPDVGSSNALLFELLLLGKFRQVPEILYFYSAKGLRYRPSSGEEYARNNGGRSMPKYRQPFLVLACNQTKGILASAWGPLWKGLLLMTLWLHVVMVNGAKAIFRLLEAGIGRRVPHWLEELCASAVLDTGDIRFIGRPEENRDYLPEGWRLRKM
jgi:glycosyltransferase involved in cell wall biosynthesis